MNVFLSKQSDEIFYNETFSFIVYQLFYKTQAPIISSASIMMKLLRPSNNMWNVKQTNT